MRHRLAPVHSNGAIGFLQRRWQYAVSASTGVAHRYIFELRYDFGFLYWDRVGRLAGHLSSEEGWDVGSMNVDRCILRNADKNIHFSYGPKKLDLAQTQSEDVVELLEAHEFAALAEQFSGDVLEALDQPFCTRIGFRFQELFGTSDQEEAAARVRSLDWARLHDDIEQRLGPVSEPSFRAVFARPGRNVRVAVTPFEQQIELPPSILKAARARARDYPRDQTRVIRQRLKAEKMVKSYPNYGVLLDLDAYLEDPPTPGVSISDFITTSHEDFAVVKKIVLAKRPT